MAPLKWADCIGFACYTHSPTVYEWLKVVHGRPAVQHIVTRRQAQIAICDRCPEYAIHRYLLPRPEHAQAVATPNNIVGKDVGGVET